MNTLGSLPSILGRTAVVVLIIAALTTALAFGLNAFGVSQTVVFVVSAATSPSCSSRSSRCRPGWSSSSRPP